jgi:hypothetical protein
MSYYLFTLGSLGFYLFFFGKLTRDNFTSLEVQVETLYFVRIKGFRWIILFNIYNGLIIHTILVFHASGNE